MSSGVPWATMRPPVIAALVNANDPGNAGTILRTADASGAGAVVFAGDSVDPYNGKAVRASAGSLFHLEVVAAHPPLDLVAADGAVIRPELTVATAAALAESNGAMAHRFERVRAVEPASNGGAVVVTDTGRASYDRVVVAAGGWTPTLLPHLRDEVVAIVAHLDSWAGATGAVDDGAELTAHLETLLGARVRSVSVQELDLADDTTRVEVRYDLPRDGGRPTRPVTAPGDALAVTR